VVDTGKQTSANQSYVFQVVGKQLQWNTSYTWKLKVWDNFSTPAASQWITGPNFKTIEHYYPVAQFVWSPHSPAVNEQIAFTDKTSFDTSSIHKSWHWTFGNNSSSSLQNPKHTYTTMGTRVVTLTATDSIGSCSTTNAIVVGVSFPKWRQISPF